MKENIKSKDYFLEWVSSIHLISVFSLNEKTLIDEKSKSRICEDISTASTARFIVKATNIYAGKYEKLNNCNCEICVRYLWYLQWNITQKIIHHVYLNLIIIHRNNINSISVGTHLSVFDTIDKI